MTSVTLTWTTEVKEHHKTEIDESDLPENWREILNDNGADELIAGFEGEKEDGTTTVSSVDVTDRFDISYEVAPDYEGLGRAITKELDLHPHAEWGSDEIGIVCNLIHTFTPSLVPADVED